MVSPTSHKQRVTWRWAHDTKTTADPFGLVIRRLRDRADMPHRFPNKTYLSTYLIDKLKLDVQLVEILIGPLWSSYYDYNSSASRSQDVA